MIVDRDGPVIIDFPQVVSAAGNSDGNDLMVWTDDDRRNERLRFTFPRQRSDLHLCISDFFRSVESGDADYTAFHVVTVGERGVGG